MAKISVIMTTYNDQNYVEQSIDSVLNQTFSDFELIVCDDCSTDDTPNIIKRKAGQDRRIRYIENEINLGFCKCLNLCANLATSPFLARMDSDDISLPDRLEIEYNFLSNNPNLAACGSSAFLFDEKGIWGLAIGEKQPKIKDALRGTPMIHPSVLMRKDALASVGYYTIFKGKIRCSEDYDLWLKMLSCGMTIENLPDVLLMYREGKESYKKRKIKYQLFYVNLQKKWYKKTGHFCFFSFSVIKNLLIGFLPRKLYQFLHRKTLINNYRSYINGKRT
jgi:glycosyltransferase EpsE